MAAQESPSFLERECRKFGFPPLIALDGEPGPAQLSYLDLLRARKTGKAKRQVLPDAVAEFQGRPLLYLLDGSTNIAERSQLRDLQLLLANRGEHAWVSVVQPGQMTVYPINLEPRELDAADPEIITVADPRCPLFFQSLALSSHSRPGMPGEADYVFNKIHALLQGASAELTGPDRVPLKPLEVLSTSGRALFFRFLNDRGIVRADDLAEICPGVASGDLLDAFSDATKAAATSAWLDETFNGDLLPLVEDVTPETSPQQRRSKYLAFYRAAGKATGGRLFAHLEAILKGWDHVGGSNFQYTIDWNDLNFAHIPVGVLSQVYETFSHQWDEPNAVETSVHYTPRKIAQLVVTESLSQLEHPARAKVLDPACGGGVFLVIAFRELVRHRWIVDNRRPAKDTIYKILYEQLCGFDISEHALRLAALGLYITAIELNSIYRPPSLHRAPKPLQGTVLHNFDDPDGHAGRRRRFVAGSLGSRPDKEFDSRFDVVFGNPPWTPLSPQGDTAADKAADNARIKAHNKQFTELGRSVLKSRGLHELARSYRNPNNVPDLPFIWRAMRWAKPGGTIAFTLDARLVLMPTGTFRDAREALLQACSVTGILNGSSLEKTPVWPGMDKPFIIFFARNEMPLAGHSFYFATPVRDTALSSRGEFLLDYTSVQTIPVKKVLQRGWLLKALTVGTSLDVEVVEKLQTSFGGRTLGNTWTPPLFSGRGFSLNPRPIERKAPRWLQDLRLFDIPAQPTLPTVSTARTFKGAYGDSAPYQTCGEEIYLAPLLLIPQSPGEDRSTPKAFLSETESLCYDQSFYGYSGGEHPDSKIYLSLLYLVMHSELFRYWCLVRSSRIGASWRTFIKDDLDSLPFPDAEQLKSGQRSRIEELTSQLRSGRLQDWDSLDTFINGLYGLSTSDAEVMNDTVTFRSQYRASRLPAEQKPEADEVKAFCRRLRELLQPLFSLTSQELEVHPITPVLNDNAPWCFASISLAGQSPVSGQSQRGVSGLIARIMRTAAKTSASRVIVRIPKEGLVLGLLNQRRFWTYSRARLCAVEVAREHSDWFPIPAAAARGSKR
jgi:hypothetical protein